MPRGSEVYLSMLRPLRRRHRFLEKNLRFVHKKQERRKQKGESRNIILLKKQFLIFPFSFLILLKVFIFYDCIIYYSIKTRDLELIALMDGKLTRFACRNPCLHDHCCKTRDLELIALMCGKLSRFAFRNPLGCDYSTLRATFCCKTRDSEIYLTRFTRSINFPILHGVKPLPKHRILNHRYREQSL